MPVKTQKNPMPSQNPRERIKNFNEVALGYTEDAVLAEAERCIECKRPGCLKGCPVEVSIPDFIRLIKQKDYLGAINKIKEKNNLPAICGRVCPQESQCEQYCLLGKKGEPVAIGRLERFVADYQLAHGLASPPVAPPTGFRVAVIGAGNVAMDAARTALRLGAEESNIVYRRSAAEMPARQEEIEHAEEEGIKFHLLTSPVEFLGDENGWLTGMRCIRYELGEPDASGRRRPVAIPGSEFEMDIDTVVIAIGQGPHPLVTTTTPGLELGRHGNIVAAEETGATSRPGVFAGGDIVTGAATVILAMGAGKKAARAIDAYLKNSGQN